MSAGYMYLTDPHVQHWTLWCFGMCLNSQAPASRHLSSPNTHVYIYTYRLKAEPSININSYPFQCRHCRCVVIYYLCCFADLEMIFYKQANRCWCFHSSLCKLRQMCAKSQESTLLSVVQVLVVCIVVGIGRWWHVAASYSSRCGNQLASLQTLLLPTSASWLGCGSHM